jgi:flagellar motor switch protein FliM
MIASLGFSGNKSPITMENLVDTTTDWSNVKKIPEAMSVFLPIDNFTALSLLQLQNGQLIHTGINTINDIPLFVGEVCLLFGEFEVVGTQMAIRITRVG